MCAYTMKEITIKIPRKVENNLQGFEFFICLYEQVKDIKNKKVILNFSKTRWFEANLTAILGAILTNVKFNNNIIMITKISRSIKRVLRKNNFLKEMGILDKVDDTYETTIKYCGFNAQEKIEFQKYIKNEFLPKINIHMTQGFIKEFRVALEELFQNARIHGKCMTVYTCGQYYYMNEIVKFTMVDLGSTIIENVKNKLKDDNIKADYAIDWATIEGNTTRKEGETGGIGLPLLIEFIQNNKGKLQIVSSNGYWEDDGGNRYSHCFQNKFPGTIVNIDVNVSDNNVYASRKETNSSEKLIENIF